jgi:2',3'-cyclic-nucleotide 2'-phosphodiesterase (5'-nucleotidase family)
MKKPSPSILVSSAALLVALGGTSYAAVQVTGKDIKNGTVTTKDVKNNNLTGRDIKNGSVKGKDLKPGTIPTGARWALVNAAGQIEAQSGGFTVVSAYPTLAPTATDAQGLRANGNVYVDAGEPLGNNAITAQVVLQNTVDQNGDGVTNGRGATANPEFSGEISVSQCGTPVTACAPAGTAVPNVFAVSPRLSDGSVTTGENRKRFYVVVVGDSSDRS